MFRDKKMHRTGKMTDNRCVQSKQWLRYSDGSEIYMDLSWNEITSLI